MTTRLVLVRHGTCARTHEVLLGRRLDAPLDATGQREARALAASLRLCGAASIHCSPRLRTRQTAAVLADALALPVRVVPALDEVDFGRWAGQSFDALEQDPDWRQWNRQRGKASTPGGEDMAAVRARALAHVRALATAEPAATHLLVTHAEVIRALLLPALGLPFDAFATVEVPTASATWMRIGAQGLVAEPRETELPEETQ